MIVARSLPEALARAREVDPEVFVFGGAGVYAEALPLADRLLVTWVDGDPAGDTFFPAVDWAGWDESGQRALRRRRLVDVPSARSTERPKPIAEPGSRRLRKKSEKSRNASQPARDRRCEAPLLPGPPSG